MRQASLACVVFCIVSLIFAAGVTIASIVVDVTESDCPTCPVAEQQTDSTPCAAAHTLGIACLETGGEGACRAYMECLK